MADLSLITVADLLRLIEKSQECSSSTEETTRRRQLIDLASLPGSALLTEKEAGVVLNVPPETLNMWRCQKRVPLPFIKLGRQVRYRVQDLTDFLERNRVPCEAEAA